MIMQQYLNHKRNYNIFNINYGELQWEIVISA